MVWDSLPVVLSEKGDFFLVGSLGDVDETVEGVLKLLPDLQQLVVDRDVGRDLCALLGGRHATLARSLADQSLADGVTGLGKDKKTNITR